MPVLEETQPVGTEEFITDLKSILSSSETRSVEEEQQVAMVPKLVEASIDFLNKNGISYKDFCEDKNDPRIAVIAAGIAEYTMHQTAQTRTTFGGCVLQSIGLKGLGQKTVKKIAKEIG